MRDGLNPRDRLVSEALASFGSRNIDGRARSRVTLEKGPFGLTQPSPASEIVRPNLVLTPLLAFDSRGRRLGYGKGHYDRATNEAVQEYIEELNKREFG